MTTHSSMIASIRRTLSFFSARQRALLIVIIFLALLTALLEMLCAGIMVKLTQAIITPDEGPMLLEKVGVADADPQRALLYIGGVLFFVYFVKNIVSLIDVAVQNFGIRRMNCYFQHWLLERFQNIDYEFFKTRHSGYGVTVVTADTEIVFSRGVLSLTAIVTELLVFAGLVAVLAYLNVGLILILMVLCLVMAGVIVKFGFPFMYALGQKNEVASLQKTVNITKYFQGYKEILLSGKADYFMESYERHLRTSTYVAACTNVFAIVPRAFIELTFLGTFVACLMFVDVGETDMGFLGAYAYAAFRIMPGMNRMINHAANFKSSIPFIQRFGDEYDRLKSESSYIDCPDLSFTRDIELKNVCFQYQSDQRPILENTNLTIKKGDFIGIVGETGSGKSTLLNIILGLLRPSSGVILIDGQYLPHDRQWHQKIGYVPQSTYLIDGTIEENIAFGHISSAVDQERLQSVIEQAQLSDLLKRLGHGLQTRVGEFGSALSGGEQQRIAIARALYKMPDILVFDEATSALDKDTEARLIETINDVHNDKTIIMIAHRLESLRYCSRIIQVENNRISEVGSYQDLLKDQL